MLLMRMVAPFRPASGRKARRIRSIQPLVSAGRHLDGLAPKTLQSIMRPNGFIMQCHFIGRAAILRYLLASCLA